jgi:hypothetical protein
MLNIITKIDCQGSNQTFTSQIGFYLWDKLLYLKKKKTTRVDLGNNWNLRWINWNEELNLFWTNKFHNSNSIICIITLSHFSSMVNNISPSLVTMELQKKLDLWTFWIKNITMNITHWTNDDIHYMTISTFFWNGGVIGLDMDNTHVIWKIKQKYVKTKK